MSSSAQNIFTHSVIPTPRQIARGEIWHVRCRVYGYCSSDSINIYARARPVAACKYSVSMSHSSGGRDRNEVPCDIQAETNFGLGLIEAAKIARQIQEMMPEIVSEYNLYTEELRQQREAELQALQAKIDSDPPMTEEIADYILTTVSDGVSFKLFNRGSARPAGTVTKRGHLFYLESSRHSRKILQSKLLTFSSRYIQHN